MVPGNEKFRFEQILKENVKMVRLIGEIDEDTDLQPLLKLSGPLVFDFSEIKAINSCGVRSWVNFLKEVSHTPVQYVECPPVIVRQLNMVPSFVGHASVGSIFVPFVCDNCDEEKLMLVNKDNFKTLAQLQPVPCSNCGKGEMELDGHPQQYTAFSKG